MKTILAGASAASVPAIFSGKSFAAETLVVADPGGVYAAAYTEAYYVPFTKETGVKIIPVARRSNPSAELKAQVDTKSFYWDICGGLTSDVADLLSRQGALEKIDNGGKDMDSVPADWRSDFYFPDGIGTFVLAYRKDRFATLPRTFADLWNLNTFPGPRGMRKFARDTIEVALRADGVPGGAEIYRVLSTPAGWDRAFAKLDQIRKNVAVWWDVSAQVTQILRNGDVDLCPTFNVRAQAAKDEGAPVEISWEGGFYSLIGWAIPKGNPKAAIGREFIKFCARPDRQAAYTAKLRNGPSNPHAIPLVPKDVAITLPSYPANLAKTTRVNDVFWGQHEEEADRRFNGWLLQG
ncbi:extracellular solute-binding protein [Paraburkholderia sp. Ac-20342]|uniref:extracellular solute-binding protein n=1 Tax=Paraburkholderia sp. Ac-20342 TaxID=2703889 RepID=UPI00198025D5|nr:extracellular solute-binding protein [Paraburkholderia sp. Ac-20342]MBN3846296.1 extracellular solute-binding protein [Paraburkholderia sp. Ac-20342]